MMMRMMVVVVVNLSRGWKEEEQEEEKDFKPKELLSMQTGDLKLVKGVVTIIGECKERSKSRRAGLRVQVQG